MQNNPQRIEQIPRLEPYPNTEQEDPWNRSMRARIFGIVAGATLLLGLIWTVFQPVIYRSSATVLMSAPRAIDATISQADVQNVAIQRTILLGNEITRRLLRQLYEGYGIEVSADYLRNVLRVEAVPDTNLVEMAAQGEDETLLPTMVDEWIDVYVDVRAEDIAQRKDTTQQMIQDEVDDLAIKLEEAREALEQYRENNEILSVERKENEVLARLDGLNKALNTAIEEEVKAKAYVETLREAIRRGDNVVPQDEKRSVSALETSLQKLRSQMAALQTRYTMDYILKEPRYRGIPGRIEELEQKLAEAYRVGRQSELANAEQAYAAAGQTTREFQQKFDDHKEGVAKFNRIYATHQALAEDLARLESLNRDAQARLVQVQVSKVEKYPQVSVIERSGGVSVRVGPNYLLLIGGTLLVALGLGVLSVWLYGYLGHRKPSAAYVTLSGVHLYPQDSGGELTYTSQARPTLAEGKNHLLQNEGGGTKGVEEGEADRTDDDVDEDEAASPADRG